MGTFEYKNGEQKKQIWIETYWVSFDLEENDGPGVEAMLACDLRRVTYDV